MNTLVCLTVALIISLPLNVLVVPQAEDKATLGPKVAEGEHVFGVAHIFASFNDTFVVRLGDDKLCIVCAFVTDAFHLFSI